MARTKYAETFVKPARPEGVLPLDEYRLRQREFVARGQDLPHAKLLPPDVTAIRSAARQREHLRRHIRDHLTNEALARQFGVHVRTIEKLLRAESWSHLP